MRFCYFGRRSIWFTYNQYHYAHVYVPFGRGSTTRNLSSSFTSYPASFLMIDDDEFSIEYIEVGNERILTPNHNEMPVYVPCLKANISIGHFVVISISNDKTVLGQILGRGHHENAVNVCCFYLFMQWKPCLTLIILQFFLEGYAQHCALMWWS